MGFRVTDGHLVPDAFLRYQTNRVEDGCLFLEIENANPSVRFSQQSILAKCDLYEAYWRSGAFERRWGARNFRVVFLMRTNAIALHQCARMQRAGGYYRTRRWYVAPFEVQEQITGAVFATPRDFNRGALYSLDD